ncbi:MAG: DUF917 domain-containing protein [SAR324 cluster bacterium]|nr:DUF917 domain-containing protein [SAR324 cluster bacterium]
MEMIEAKQMHDVAVGGAVMGTGGGGDPYVGKLMAMQSIQKNAPVQLIDVDELGDGDLVACAAMMGAPTVMLEKFPQGEEIVTAYTKLGEFMGKPVSAVMCAECGGLNSTTPFIVAAEMGLPLVDGDGMGRAYPELQMVSFTIHGVSATPMVMSDDKGNSVLLDTVDNKWTERLARSATVDMGGSALIALYPMDGATAKKSLIRGTISLCKNIGETLRQTRQENRNPVEALRTMLGAFELFEAKVTDVERRTEGGFARGTATLDGIDRHVDSSFQIEFQNEFLIAKKNGEAIISTPDLITLLDIDTGEPVTTESLRFGLRVVGLGIPSDPKWRTPEGLKLVGPQYFGYDTEFIPIEERLR